MRLLTRILSSLVLSAPLASADVLIVDKSGTQGFTTVQAAINASQDGDIVLVRSGTYPQFAVSMRSLTIRADLGAEVLISSGVSVLFTPAQGTVLLAGLVIHGKPSASGSQPGGTALTLADNSGFVRIQECTLIGGAGLFVNCQVNTSGGDACVVSNSLQTAFVDCLLEGGPGGGDLFQPCFGGTGGSGLRAGLSGVALYDCIVWGGNGGFADVLWASSGGHGGIGHELLEGWTFASNTQIRGGQGGQAGLGGDGGDGLVAQGLAQAQLLDSLTLGGFAGLGEIGADGTSGQGSSGSGQILVLPGSSRVLEAPALAGDGSSLELGLQGLPGDAIWVASGWTPGHMAALIWSGVWLVARPGFLTKAPLVVLGPTGTATVTLHAPALDAGQGSRTLFLQAFALGTDGKLTLSSPAHVSVFDCAGEQPDCNGSGTFDLCDVLAGSSPDCDGNAVPDECDVDCNSNGVPDACDIASAVSEDKNHNGIPDECEAQGVTWHVDNFAAPGGDGSPASPFKTIGDAMAIALGGDTILVAPGVYKGAKNRNLDFGGRDIVVRGTGGSSTCVIDCESEKPAFTAQGGETAASLIEGFTIRRGRSVTSGGGIRLDGADTTIRDVVFEECRAWKAGGGLDLTDSRATVTQCRFEGNDATRGAGLSIHGGSPKVSRSTFLENHCSSGGDPKKDGVIYVSSGLAVLMTHLTLLDHHDFWPEIALVIEGGAVNLANCLFAGSLSTKGGAIRVLDANLYVRGCTFAGNVAYAQDGIIRSENSDGLPRTLRLDNCIVWDDPALNGGLIVNVTPGVTVQVESSNLRGGSSSIVLAAGSSLAWGQGNLDLDPLFVDPDGPDNVPATFLDNDYRLGPLSPSIDAGYNVWVIPDVYDLDGDGNTSEPTPIDLDGLPRFVDVPGVPDTGAGTPPIVDMGAFERQ